MAKHGLRRFQEADFAGYSKLFSDVYNHTLDKDFFNWKHRVQEGEPLIYLVVDEKDNIVGANSFFPCILCHGEQRYAAVQSGDTMVSSAHRGQGLFKKVLVYAINELQGLGFQAIVGFANSNSYPGFLKIGFKGLGKIDQLTKVLRVEGLLGRKYNRPLMTFTGSLLDTVSSAFSPQQLKSHKIEDLEEPTAEVASFIEGCMGIGERIRFHKDTAYLVWKFREKPASQYKFLLVRKEEVIQAFFVVKVTWQGRFVAGSLVDYFTTGPTNLEEGLRALSHTLRQKGFYSLSMWEPPAADLAKACRANKFLLKPNEIYFIVYPLADQRESLTEAGSWHFVSGDADTA